MFGNIEKCSRRQSVGLLVEGERQVANAKARKFHFVTFISSTGINKRVLLYSGKVHLAERLDQRSVLISTEIDFLFSGVIYSGLPNKVASLIMLLFMQSALTEPSREIMQIAAESRKQIKCLIQGAVG